MIYSFKDINMLSMDSGGPDHMVEIYHYEILGGCTYEDTGLVTHQTKVTFLFSPIHSSKISFDQAC